MRKNGFTLVELLLVLTLVGTLLTLSVHTFRQLSEQRLLTQPLASLTKALRFARAAAIGGAHDVTLCRSGDGDTCGGDGYEQGWIVFTDRPGAGAGRRDPGERLLAATAALDERLSLRSNTFVSYITFRADGRANGNGRFVICADDRPDGAVGVFVIRSGRLRPAAAGELDRCLT